MVPSAPGEYVYGLEGQIIRCPHHGWEFDLESGASVFTGATARLIRYPVEIENDHIFVWMKTPAS